MDADFQGSSGRRVFSGPLWVHYGQAYVLAGNRETDLAASFRGQVNGLCGAAVPGQLFLITGLHTGHVGFTVDICAAWPVVDDSWEEIVEVSFTVAVADVSLQEWGGRAAYSLPLHAANYRVRYCARGMQHGHDLDTSQDDDRPADSYSLAFWPAPPAPDQVVKQTSEIAAYWHATASSRTESRGNHIESGDSQPSWERQNRAQAVAERKNRLQRGKFEVRPAVGHHERRIT